ncbi:alpha-1-antitrypsin homolog [Salarias fasciatus]|uniref:alpha-1-antitrypsin homolog n=1 Tax=Salarias fasciatus TaxID=181472 RepID=UPI0011767EE1|nr:alpha-1-antitrypsin homolog [Salarias fasciatus]
MHSTFASCVIAAVFVAVALADHHDHHHGHDHHSHEESYACHKLSEPNAEFALALYKKLDAHTEAGKNIFYSPISISAALSMLSSGARGDTRSQLMSTLGYAALNQTQVDDGYEHFFHVLEHQQANQQLDVGNVVAVRTGFQPSQQFVADIKQHYVGELHNVDFANPKEAVAQMNKLIASKTHDKIKDMVKDLDPGTIMVLLNYVYFRGQWEHLFDANLTSKEDFHVDESTTVQVDMMKRTGHYDIYEDNDNHTTVVRLPYKGNTSMIIVLPDEGKMKEVEDGFTMERFQHWTQSFFKKIVDLSMPKFSISAEASLEQILQELGVTDAFSVAADFSGLSQDIKLIVSKVSHQAVLSVDETGTEAAGTTTIELGRNSSLGSVNLNRPFLVFIVDSSTETILFMGKINNPTAL